MIYSKRFIKGLVTLVIMLFMTVPDQAVLAGGTVTNCSDDTQVSSILASGGTVSFNCNGTGDVATILLTSTKTISTSVTIDGAGKITLSGNNVRRLFQVEGGVTLTLLNITITNGKAIDGGGAVLNNGSLIVQGSTFTNNSTTGNYGGAIKNNGSITITNSTFSNNTAPEGYGGAIDIALTTSSIDVTNSTFDNNSAKLGGGALASNGIITITNSTFKNNVTSSFQGTSGGGAIETTKSLTVSKSTFNNNTAGKGGAIYNEGGNATITNSTFSANSVNVSPYTGGAIHNQSNGTVLVIATTFSGNSATSGLGGTLYNTAGNSLTVRESILAGGSPNNCSGTIAVQGKNMETGTDCNFTASGNLQNTNPQLGVLANNGGFTQTLALLAGSPAIDAGNDATCEATDQRGVTRPQESHCDIGAYEFNSAIIDVTIGSTPMGSYTIPSGGKEMPRYGMAGGPVRVKSVNGKPIFTSQRAAYLQSFNELMGYPANQLTTEYWFTYYDDIYMSTWLMIGNAHPSQTAEVNVYIGGGSTPTAHYSIAKGQSVLPRFGIAGGPVRVVSTNGVDIFTSQRAAYLQSFNELMGYPANQLTTEYWFTYYDDIYMSTWLMIGNAHPSQTAEVDVYIGGGSTPTAHYSIAKGQSVLPRFGIAGGPVRVVSTNGVPIFTSQRAAYIQSFNELMGYPANQLTTEYWFTYYDDIYMSTWLMIGNPDATRTAEVDVYIGGGTTPTAHYSIPKGESVLPRFGIAGGPVRVVSTNGVPIFTSQRAAYLQSFNELMGYPANQLTTEYWFTYYDDIYMSTWLMMGVP